MLEGSSGPTTFTFDVTLDVAISEDVTFNYTTVSDTALAGSDFQAVNGSGRIPAGQTATTIEVTVTGDSAVESDERFFVNISNRQASGLLIEFDCTTYNRGYHGVGFRTRQVSPKACS